MTKEVKFSSMHLTPLFLCNFLVIHTHLSKVVYQIGYLSIGSNIPEHEVMPAHRTEATSICPHFRDAFLAKSMTTFNAHRLLHGIQTDGTLDFLPNLFQGHCWSRKVMSLLISTTEIVCWTGLRKPPQEALGLDEESARLWSFLGLWQVKKKTLQICGRVKDP